MPPRPAARPLYDVDCGPLTSRRSSMQRFLNWLRRLSHTPSTSARPRPIRPRLEHLEDRMVPSATSAISTWHGGGWFRWQTHDLYAIDATTKQVVDFQTSTFGGSTRTAL